ncbi:glycerol-3-phosphate responsive antiterminator [Lacrimispora sp. 210928-DFI.3.58]|uniref:glycerol-3-phosphate responsive antiterminator n=1 Tax=Lacrimispora sp. 210928-DFI.3.58 TaxID=2883214 RepID=UPI001D096ABB|nr:glycerol-3-phosphate responsive antiterminator [Lacrimispora sp. 210928-DFI.3.58]MCB7320505.1 glycerol-3-phosphate responsive antiterminator [Lacrimispora sp. 210928-DFI.3.58]
MDQRFYDLMEANPVIAAVKDMEGLAACCEREEIKIVFVLFGDICNISSIVKRIKDAGKISMVHIDLITGLSGKEVAVDFIKENTRADGIISTKPALIKRARELSLYTTLRVFVLDSMAFENIEKQMSVARPDVIEILPGLMPKVIKRVCKLVRVPVIAGGLISDKEDVMAALSAGAISVSTTNPKVWLM